MASVTMRTRSCVSRGSCYSRAEFVGLLDTEYALATPACDDTVNDFDVVWIDLLAVTVD